MNIQPAYERVNFRSVEPVTALKGWIRHVKAFNPNVTEQMIAEAAGVALATVNLAARGSRCGKDAGVKIAKATGLISTQIIGCQKRQVWALEIAPVWFEDAQGMDIRRL